MSTTTLTPGRHKRTHAGSRVPTDRSHASCAGTHHITDEQLGRPSRPCPVHLPALYALEAAKHRSDRP